MRKKHNKLLWHLRVLLSSILGTTAMTMFSYLLSAHQHKNFREPDLLDKLVHRLLRGDSKKQQQPAGWFLHYLTGLLFAEAYTLFWTANAEKNLRSGLMLGGISGIAAILIWKFAFSSHPDPPHVDFISFAAQLFVAHVIFGAFVALGYNLVKPSNSNKRLARTLVM